MGRELECKLPNCHSRCREGRITPLNTVLKSVLEDDQTSIGLRVHYGLNPKVFSRVPHLTPECFLFHPRFTSQHLDTIARHARSSQVSTVKGFCPCKAA